jgi:CRP-like cAMP-binding protein
VFGEMSIINKTFRTASVVTRSPVEVRALSD